MNFATQAIHAGQGADPSTGATVIPIHPSTTFTQRAIGEHQGFEYSRTGNPTRAALESCLAALEGAKHGVAFASGSAAGAAVLSQLRPGDHLIAGEDLYGGTYRQLERLYRPLGVETTYVDLRHTDDLGAAFTPRTRLLWLETPTNPLLQLADIAALAAEAEARGVPVVVDNTFATPYLQQPLRLGATLVVHSTTKYIGGHSDVVGGAVLTNSDAWAEKLRFYQNAAGAVPSPFDAWLTLRGVKTLALRMARHCDNALRLAHFLAAHPAVAAVYYPGLPSHPQHALALRQMPQGRGGMLSFVPRGGVAAAERFIARTRIISFAESLGGVESLLCHPATMTHAAIPAEERARRGISDALLRLSVGIEDAEDLQAEIAAALEEG